MKQARMCVLVDGQGGCCSPKYGAWVVIVFDLEMRSLPQQDASRLEGFHCILVHIHVHVYMHASTEYMCTTCTCFDWLVGRVPD